MPRHKRDATPPEKRRAEKGSTVGRFKGDHTPESKADFDALQAYYRLSIAGTFRKALELARKQLLVETKPSGRGAR